VERKTLITRTDQQLYRSLGVHGHSVIQAFAQLRDVVGSRLTPRHQGLFSEPVADPEARGIDWYTDAEGEPTRLVDLPEDQQAAIEAELETLKQDLMELSGALIRAGEAGGANLIGTILQLSVTVPGPEHVYMVGDQPVLTLWGHELAKSLTVVTPTPPGGPKAEPVQVTPLPYDPDDRRRGIWGWLRWLLLLLLLALLLFWLLRGCDRLPFTDEPTAPVTSSQPIVEPEKPTTDDGLDELRKREEARLSFTDEPTAPVTSSQPIVEPEKPTTDDGLDELRKREEARLPFTDEPTAPVTSSQPIVEPEKPTTDDGLDELRKREEALRDEMARLQREYNLALRACRGTPTTVLPRGTGQAEIQPTKPVIPQTDPDPNLPLEPPLLPEQLLESEQPDQVPEPEQPEQPKPEQSEPPQPESPDPSQQPKDKPPKEARECPAPRMPFEAPEVVVVLDASRSMKLPLNTDPARERDLLQRVQAGDAAAIAELKRMETQPGAKRLDQAVNTLSQMVAQLPKDVDVGLTSFNDCKSIVNHRFYQSSKRGNLIKAIRGVKVKGGTPLARAVQRAGNIIKGVDKSEMGMIVVVTDGLDTCGGNVCAVARSLKKQKPGLRISLIDLGGHRETHCLATETGGQVYGKNDLPRLVEIVKKFTEQQLPPNCIPRKTQ
jgi:hypothetical protein